MKIAITPFMVAILFISFFVRGEILVATRAEYGYLFGNLAFGLCFVVLYISLFVLLAITEYDGKKLLSVKVTRRRIIDFVGFCLISIFYVFLTVRFGGDLVTGRFAILLVPIPMLVVLYLLELRWVSEV